VTRFGPFRGALALAAGDLSAASAAAEETFAAGFEARLVEGRIGAATAFAEARRAAPPEDAAAHFALGLAQFLAAVERLGQGL
jgi:hypothetical protein